MNKELFFDTAEKLNLCHPCLIIGDSDYKYNCEKCIFIKVINLYNHSHRQQLTKSQRRRNLK